MKKIISLLFALAISFSASAQVGRTALFNIWKNRLVPTTPSITVTFGSMHNILDDGIAWTEDGNALGSNTRFLGSTDNRSILFKTNNTLWAKLDSIGVLRLFNTAATPTTPGSLYYDGTLNGFTIATYTNDPTWVFTIKNHTVNAVILPNLFATGANTVYNGPWFGSQDNLNVHIFSNGNGGGTPGFTYAKTGGPNGGNNPIILNGYTTYTASAILRVTSGGMSSYIECEGTQGNLPFRIQKRAAANFADIGSNGVATIGSTVITAGQPTFNCIGNASVSSNFTATGNSQLTGSVNMGAGANITTTLTIANSNTLVGGNSGTIAVLTDNLFTINTNNVGFNFADATTYYWSDFFTSAGSPRVNVDQSLSGLPYNCTLVGANITTWSASSGTTNEATTINFRKNGSDNVISNAVTFNTGAATSQQTNVTGLNVSCTAGDTWEIKVVTPTWVTNPTSAYYKVTLYFARR